MGFIIFTTLLLLVGLGLLIFAPSKDKNNPSNEAPAMIKYVGGGVHIFVWVVIMLFSSYLQVDEGEAVVERMLGVVNHNEYYNPGVQLKNPYADVVTYDIRQQTIEFNNENTLSATTNDSVILPNIDATVLWRRNGSCTSLILAKIGDDGADVNFVRGATRSAFRDAAANFEAIEMVSDKREAFSVETKTRLQELLDLQMERLVEDEDTVACRSFIVDSVLVRKVTLPDHIKKAVDAKVAAQQELERQETLTEIANEEAQRRQNEGKGIANLLNQIPFPEGTKLTAEQVVSIIRAQADQTRANALEQAIKNELSNIIVMEGGGGSISVKP